MSFPRKWKNGSKQTRRTYASWISMLHRCYNSDQISYPYYGGRGITVCSRWRDSYDHFVEDMGLRPQGTTLDRVENDKPYQLENCRWATIEIQNRHKRNTPALELNGEAKTLAEWARELPISREGVAYRLKAGISLARALNPEPLRAPPQHGSVTMSTGRYRCRCEPCKAAKKAYDRERYLKQRANRPVIFDL